MRNLVILSLIAGAVTVLEPDQGRRPHALGRAWLRLGGRA